MKRHFAGYVMKQQIVYVTASAILVCLSWFVSPKMNQKIAMTVMFSVYFLYHFLRMVAGMVKASSSFERDEELIGQVIENAVFTEKEIIAWYERKIHRIRYVRVKSASHDGNVFTHYKVPTRGRRSVTVKSNDDYLKVYVRDAQCAELILNLIETKNPQVELKYKSSKSQVVYLKDLNGQ